MRSNEWYDNNKDIILTMYYDNKTVEEICSTLSCNRSMIYRKLKEWDVERRSRIKPSIRHNAKYDVDYKYFDNVDCEHKAYWLGLLLADGFVNDKEISLCLQKSDLKTIEYFKSDINAWHPIAYNKDGNPFIIITCKRLCDTLISYGFHNRKSWKFDMNKLLDIIPIEYENHFIRGMFDGDGCIKYYIYDYFKKPQFHFGYTGLENVCEYINNKLNLKSKLYLEGNITYTVRTRNPKLIMDIFGYLYKDATIYMDRKYNTFIEMQSMINN